MKRWTAVLRAAAAACLLAVVTWQVVAGGPLTAKDVPVHLWVLRHPLARSRPLWAGLTELGDGRITLPALCAVAALVGLRRRTPRPLIVPAAVLGLSAALLELMKAAIGRAATTTGSDAVFAGGAEFPSGHTATATVICGMIVYLAFCVAGRESRPACGRACLVAGGIAGACAGAAVVRMDYHWLTDAAGGWLLGILALDVMLLVRRAWRDRHGPEQARGHARTREPRQESAASREP